MVEIGRITGSDTMLFYIFRIIGGILIGGSGLGIIGTTVSNVILSCQGEGSMSMYLGMAVSLVFLGALLGLGVWLWAKADDF